VTAETGQFRIDGVKAGDYYGSFQKFGYFPADPHALAVQPIQTGPGKDSPRLRIELAPAGSVQGRVLDPDGKPIAGAQVEAQPDMGKVAISRDDGYYKLDGLAPGSYTLRAWPPERQPAVAPDGTRTKLVPTFYPSGTDAAQASKIEVRGGDRPSGYDFTVQSAAVYRIRGVVLDETGRPADRVHVSVARDNSGIDPGVSFAPGGMFSIGIPLGREQEAGTTTDQNGKFEFSAVRSGDWAIIAEAGINRYGLTNVSVGRRDLDDVRVEIAPSFDSNVALDWADESAPKSNWSVSVMLLGYDALHQVHPGRLQADGTIHFAEVRPGRYRVFAASSGGGYYASAVLLGSMGITGQLVDLTAVSPPLHIVLKPNAGTVRGKVEQGAGATVALFTQTFVSGAGGDFVRIAKCGPDGEFEFSGLPPGSYQAIASESALDSSRIRSLISSASSVRVEEGSASTLELRLSR
jgi:hypothetical protein